MMTQRGSRGDRESHTPSVTVAACATLLIVGAGVLFLLPDDSSGQPDTAASNPNNRPAEMTAEESFCNKQAWPYVDQRCAQRAETSRGTRQIRIVTDKGQSVRTVAPMPVVEPKSKAAPKPPVVARNDRQIGPSVTPAAPEGEPRIEPVVDGSHKPAPPPQATAAQGTEAFASAPPIRKSRAEQRRERKAARREAKRRQMIERTTGNNNVPNEIIDEATRGQDRAVTIGSPFGGRRVYIVPAEPQ